MAVQTVTRTRRNRCGNVNKRAMRFTASGAGNHSIVCGLNVLYAQCQGIDEQDSNVGITRNSTSNSGDPGTTFGSFGMDGVAAGATGVYQAVAIGKR